MTDLGQFEKDLNLRQAELNTENYVAMANSMVQGISRLGLEEMKLLRFLIMQVKPTDNELHTYTFTATEFGAAMGIERSNIYRKIDSMTSNLMCEVIKIQTGLDKKGRKNWKKFNWVDYAIYEDGKITIKLHDSLKPFITDLKRHYTQYRLEEIVRFRNTYTIHLYELILMAKKSAPVYADQTVEVYIGMDTLRKATNTNEKPTYDHAGRFKERILNPAIDEINKKSVYYLTVRDYKEGRKITGFYFKIESQSYHLLKEVKQEKYEQLSLDLNK